jgi:hypothetical protein
MPRSRSKSSPARPPVPERTDEARSLPTSSARVHAAVPAPSWHGKPPVAAWVPTGHPIAGNPENGEVPREKPRGPGTFEQWGAIFFFIALFAVGLSCRSFGDAPPSYLGAETCAGCRARRVARRSFERGLEGCREARDGADRAIMDLTAQNASINHSDRGRRGYRNYQGDD